jgi:Collagen triple helix repeat (20 copies)
MKWIAAAVALTAVLFVAAGASADQGRRLTGPVCIGKSGLNNLEGRARGINASGRATQRWAILRAGVVRSVAAKRKCFPWEIRRNGVGLPQTSGPRGPQGERGAQGPQGAQGAQGAAGATGAAGPAGPAGSAGAVGATGAKGDKGDRGDAGAGGLGDRIVPLCLNVNGGDLKYGGPEGADCDNGHPERLRVVIVGNAP